MFPNYLGGGRERGWADLKKNLMELIYCKRNDLEWKQVSGGQHKIGAFLSLGREAFVSTAGPPQRQLHLSAR